MMQSVHLGRFLIVHGAIDGRRGRPRFLGEQIKRLQGDVRKVKSDMAQMRADNVKVESNVAALKTDLTRIENKLEAFHESVDDRFDQTIELMKSSFRTLRDEIQSLKEG